MKAKSSFASIRSTVQVFYYSASIILTCSGFAATNDLSGLLQKGLFEEEANRNLDAATAAYQTLVTQFDQDRQIGATAIFRLGEVYRKQGKTNEAAVQYERIVRDFAEQSTLVILSRQNLVGLGKASVKPAVGPSAAIMLSPEAQELERSEKILAQLQDWDLSQLRRLIPTLLPDAEFERISEQLRKNEGFVENPNPQILTQRTVYRDQLQKRAEEIMVMLARRVALLRETVAKQNSGNRRPLAENETAVASVTDEEEAEIRRIQAMIQNSPDLINAPSGDPSRAPLGRAAEEGQLRVAEYLLNNGADVNFKTGGLSPLILATRGGHKTMVELLIARGAVVDAQGSSSKTSLHVAVEQRFPSVVGTLLASKADPNAKDSGGNTPLILAVRQGSMPMVALLLTNQALVNLTNKSGETALHGAAEAGQTEIAAALIQAGAEVNAPTSFGVTPLHGASHNGRIEVMKLLLENGGNPNAIAKGWGAYSPLILAALREEVSPAELLLRHKADPNHADASGNTALMNAVSRQNIGAVRALLSSGADPDVKSTTGFPVLGIAADGGNHEIVAALIGSHAKLNVTNASGATPLHIAVLRSSKGVAELLLAAGAEVNVRDRSGKTALDYAKSMPAPLAGQQIFVGGIQVSAQPNLVKAAGIADLLRQHGALDDLPDFNSIRITRQGFDRPLVVFTKAAKLTNHFSLLETVIKFYSQFSVYSGPGSANRPAHLALPFPDLGRIVIRRPSQKTGGREQEIKVSLLNNSNVVDCAKDLPVEFGDVIEIPERVHALNEFSIDPFQAVKSGLSEVKSKSHLAQTLTTNLGSATNSTAAFHLKMAADAVAAAQQWACLQKSVQLIVGGETVAFSVDSWTEGFLSQALAKTEARSALRSSSDLSRVKVTRKDAKTGKSIALTVDATETNDSLWLQAGDVIEVPDKP